MISKLTIHDLVRWDRAKANVQTTINTTIPMELDKEAIVSLLANDSIR